MINKYLFIAVIVFLSACSKPHDPSGDFVLTWKTDRPGKTSNTKVEIPIGSGDFDYDVDWNNDGVFDQKHIRTSIVHDFKEPGTYTIRIRGKFPHMKMYRLKYDPKKAPSPRYDLHDAKKLVSVNQWGNQKWGSMNRMFAGTRDLTIVAKDTPDLSNVRDMSNMLINAKGFNSPIQHWDVSKVTDMRFMFHSASSFNQPLNQWNTSNVTQMDSMFAFATSFNQPLDKWQITQVTGMDVMFAGAVAFNQSLSTWNLHPKVFKSDMFAGIKNPPKLNSGLKDQQKTNK